MEPVCGCGRAPAVRRVRAGRVAAVPASPGRAWRPDAGRCRIKPVRDYFESFTWSPPIPGAWLVLLSVAVALLMAIALAGQYRAAKRRWLLPVLWLLRAAAVAAVALALAGPSQKLTKRESSRQAVSIIIDASGSMSLTDPDGFVPDWTFGQPDDPARGALAAARHRL